jgi:hypothetical protein
MSFPFSPAVWIAIVGVLLSMLTLTRHRRLGNTSPTAVADTASVIMLVVGVSLVAIGMSL